MYYRNAQAALVVYDLTKPSSLIKAKHWVAELQRQASPGIVIALVGNKLDLTSEGGEALGDEGEPDGAGVGEGEESADARKVSTREARDYAEEENLLFFETSAKTGTNVQEVFTAIANKIPESAMKGPKGAAAGAQGAGGRGQGDSRVNLSSRAQEAAKGGDNCAC